MTRPLSDIEDDAAWHWKQEAIYSGKAAYQRRFNKDEHAARRFDFISAAHRACAIKAEGACSDRSSSEKVA